MSLTLGEKLRQAREERGISLSEVAEQTRISSLYLESIEHDDYRNLPGGIFNKGFVKSFAKYVGINEQEALSDYTRLIAGTDDAKEPELKLYKPEVLTDDRAMSSMAPTIIVAVVILALMTGGILFLVNYLRQPAAPPANVAVGNTNSTKAGNTQSDAPSADAPSMATLKVEFKATSQPVRLMATVDGAKSDNVVASGTSATFEPKESLTLNYNRWNASVAQLTINGKAITLPATPLTAADKDRIIITISKDNIAQILASGSISTDVPAAVTDANANVAAPTTGTTVPTQPRPTPVAKPSVAANTAANTAAKPPTNAKPANTPAKPPAMTAKPKPTP